MDGWMDRIPALLFFTSFDGACLIGNLSLLPFHGVSISFRGLLGRGGELSYLTFFICFGVYLVGDLTVVFSACHSATHGLTPVARHMHHSFRSSWFARLRYKRRAYC